MNDEPLAEYLHPTSQRRAIVAHEPGSVWLYLTQPHNHAIAADCWLFNHGPAPAPEVLRGEGAPPPAPFEELEPGGEVAQLPPDLALLWTADGEAVAACSGGAILGFIGPGARHGQSRFLRHPGPWGRPYDPAESARLFGTKRR